MLLVCTCSQVDGNQNFDGPAASRLHRINLLYIQVHVQLITFNILIIVSLLHVFAIIIHLMEMKTV